MSGRWSGGVANRTWQRPGVRVFDTPDARHRFHERFADVMQQRFWCDTCGGTHRLIEHRDCRAANPFMTALKGG